LQRPSDQSDERPRDERTGADAMPVPSLPPFRKIVKQRHHPLLAELTPLLNHEGRLHEIKHDGVFR
jgi:hypothetical protein